MKSNTFRNFLIVLACILVYPILGEACPIIADDPVIEAIFQYHPESIIGIDTDQIYFDESRIQFINNQYSLCDGNTYIPLTNIDMDENGRICIRTKQETWYKCENCGHHWNPNSTNTGSTCPVCKKPGGSPYIRIKRK